MIIEFLSLIDDPESKTRFQELYDRYKSLVMWISLKKLDDEQIAEDCVQETFLYIAKHFDKIGEVNTPETKCYVSTIAQGIAISRYRKEKIIRYFNSNTDIVPFGSTDNVYGEVELSSIIDMLPDEDRNMLYLKYVFGYKSSEIAQVYNISDALVRKRLEYIRKRLKKMVGED
ncbi:MAG: RNA polymerase sigma factor [Eubacterium sp.]